MKSNANLSSVQGGGTSTSSNSSISGSVGVGGAYDTSRNSLDIKDKSIFSQLKSVLCLDTDPNPNRLSLTKGAYPPSNRNSIKLASVSEEEKMPQSVMSPHLGNAPYSTNTSSTRSSLRLDMSVLDSGLTALSLLNPMSMLGLQAQGQGQGSQGNIQGIQGIIITPRGSTIMSSNKVKKKRIEIIKK